jgi:hypothetical protein
LSNGAVRRRRSGAPSARSVRGNALGAFKPSSPIRCLMRHQLNSHCLLRKRLLMRPSFARRRGGLYDVAGSPKALLRK